MNLGRGDTHIQSKATTLSILAACPSLTSSVVSLPFTHSVPVTSAPLLSLKHSRQAPTLEPSIPSACTLFSQMPTW